MSKGNNKEKVPKMAIYRLSSYKRALKALAEEGIAFTSSHELSQLTGYTAAQIRKDLALFGQFGIPGVGYKVQELLANLEKILGVHRVWEVALVGVGNLGSALLAYRRFRELGFEVTAAFDSDLFKIGKIWEGVKIEDWEKIPSVVREKGIKIGIICVPAESAQAVADKLVEGGVVAILNFAPTRVSVPEGVHLRNVDLAVELEHLSYFLCREKKEPACGG